MTRTPAYPQHYQSPKHRRADCALPARLRGPCCSRRGTKGSGGCELWHLAGGSIEAAAVHCMICREFIGLQWLAAQDPDRTAYGQKQRATKRAAQPATGRKSLQRYVSAKNDFTLLALWMMSPWQTRRKGELRRARNVCKQTEVTFRGLYVSSVIRCNDTAGPAGSVSRWLV